MGRDSPDAASRGTPGEGPSEGRRRFEELSKKCSERAIRYIRVKLWAMLRRRVESEDVLQEVLLEASRLVPETEWASMGEADFYPLLTGMIDNKIRALVRFHLAQRRAVHREVPLSPEEGDAPGGGKTPSAELMARELSEDLERAIGELPARQQEVIRLVHLEKLRVAEAADLMGKTPNATSVLLYHALKRLGTILRGKEL